MGIHLNLRIVAVGASALAVLGCSAGPGNTSQDSITTTDETDPPGSIRVDGVLYVAVTGDWKPPPVSSKPLREQTVDQIAEAFRPIRVQTDETGVRKYRAADLNYEVAAAIKAGAVLGAGKSTSSLFGAKKAGDLSPDYFFDPRNPGNPIVADLSTAANPTQFPFNAVVYLNGLNGKCSGAYVGPHTLFTAAHCLSLNQVDNTFFMTFTPGATGYNGQVQSAPYGTFPNYARGSTCFTSVYAAAWDSNNCPQTSQGDEDTCESYDFAAVDFRQCGNPTIQNWFGVASNWSFGQTTANLYGYPGPYNLSGSPPDPVGGSTFPGCGTDTNPQGHYPFLCGSSTTAVFVHNSAMESDSNVNSPGFSGGPWWVVGADAWVTGINDGETSYFDFLKCGFNNCNRNFARYIDSSVWNFMTSNTEL